MTDRAFLYTCNRHFPLIYLHQVGRSLASANLLVSPAYGQELYVGVDDGADSAPAASSLPVFLPLWGAGNRHFGSLRPASLRRHMRSAAPFSPQFCTCAPTAERRCPLGSVHAGEQPHRSRSATVSRSERSAQATRPPLAALATDLIASSISRPSASKLSMMDIVDREADAERPRGG